MERAQGVATKILSLNPQVFQLNNMIIYFVLIQRLQQSYSQVNHSQEHIKDIIRNRSLR